MANFSYKAADKAGRTVQGSLEADSRRQAVALLRTRGLIPLEIAAAEASGKTSKPGLLHALREKLRPVPRAAVAGMARQLAVLLHAGLPLDEALSSLCADGGERGGNARLRHIMARLRDRIREGGDLADGLAEFPSVFSSTFVTMVRAGEASGTLELVIERYADHMDKQVALVRKVQSTLAYPAFMLTVGLGIVLFLLIFVIPKVTQIFTDLDRALPVPTQILIAISDVLRGGWWIILPAFAGAGVLLWQYGRTQRGKRRLHRLWLKTPGIRSLLRPLLLGHMTRTLGMLLKNGVPLLKALQIVQSISDNTLLAESVNAMIEGVQSGRELSSFMTEPLLFPPLARRMVAAGERSGRLAEMLLWVAEDSDSLVASRLQMLTALLEPVMILVLGGLVGFVVIAIILPIFEMSSLVS
ncbi:type II secretion system F family protein [Mailhella sp.]